MRSSNYISWINETEGPGIILRQELDARQTLDSPTTRIDRITIPAYPNEVDSTEIARRSGGIALSDMGMEHLEDSCIPVRMCSVVVGVIRKDHKVFTGTRVDGVLCSPYVIGCVVYLYFVMMKYLVVLDLQCAEFCVRKIEIRSCALKSG